MRLLINLFSIVIIISTCSMAFAQEDDDQEYKPYNYYATIDDYIYQKYKQELSAEEFKEAYDKRHEHDGYYFYERDEIPKIAQKTGCLEPNEIYRIKTTVKEYDGAIEGDITEDYKKFTKIFNVNKKKTVFIKSGTFCNIHVILPNNAYCQYYDNSVAACKHHNSERYNRVIKAYNDKYGKNMIISTKVAENQGLSIGETFLGYTYRDNTPKETLEIKFLNHEQEIEISERNSSILTIKVPADICESCCTKFTNPITKYYGEFFTLEPFGNLEFVLVNNEDLMCREFNDNGYFITEVMLKHYDPQINFNNFNAIPGTKMNMQWISSTKFSKQLFYEHNLDEKYKINELN